MKLLVVPGAVLRLVRRDAGARAVRGAFAAALVAYAIVAATRGWWPSMLTAPIVAWLLWRQHRRARFTAYIFFSVMSARAALIASWPLALFALASIGLLQLPPARRAWPRLTRGAPVR